MGDQQGTNNNSNNNNNNNNNNQANQIAKKVKKQIGLTAVGGLGGQNQGYIAANAPDPLMYGGAASQAAQQQMQAAGMGTITPQGSFQNIVKGKDGKMQIVSGAGAMMGTGMGTGEQTVMGQIPISQKMFEQQKKIQMIAYGAMALTGIPLMGAAYLDVRKKKYDDYISSFNNIVKSSTSYAAASTDKTTSEPQQASALDQATAQEAAETKLTAEQRKRFAIARKQQALSAQRKFLATTAQTITGGL